MCDASPSDAAKERVRAQWNEVAPTWHGWTSMMREQFALATRLMLDRAHLRPGAHVLDVAAGDGYQSLAAAERVGPGGRVVAVDLAPELLRYAEAAALEAGASHIETSVMDAEDLDFPDASFDAVVCHFGLMFFPSPDRALREMRRVLKPRGRASLVVYAAGGSPEATIAGSILRARLQDETQGAVERARLGRAALLEPDGLVGTLAAAGFSDVEANRLSVPLRLASVDDAIRYMRDAYPSLRAIAARLAPGDRTEAWHEVAAALAPFETADQLEIPNHVIVVAGTRPA